MVHRIIGGSPCQDLTYAGYLHGLLGLVGARSRLFFLLLLTIRTIQILVGISSVRFLVEKRWFYEGRTLCCLLQTFGVAIC